MIILKQVTHYPDNSVEATWVDEISPAYDVPESTAPDTKDRYGKTIPGKVTPAHTIPAVQVQVKCHSYHPTQMQMFRDDIAQFGGNLADHAAVIATVEAAIPVPTPQELESQAAAFEASRVAQLWQAAHDYEYAQVSGSAIGLLAMGVMQGLPKCLAVQGWIKTIWTEYYTRKATGSTDYSFGVAGACPHTVPELMLELGV